jgi:hypothetical protein
VDALLESGLSIRMDAGDDEFALCGTEISGPVQIGAGLGSDTYIIDDAEFHSPVTIGSGDADDTILIETRGDPHGPATIFHAQSSIRGKAGHDRIRLGRDGESGNSVKFSGSSDVHERRSKRNGGRTR